MPTRRDILHRIARPLEALYGEREARQIALAVLSERTGLGISALLADPEASADDAGIDPTIEELVTGRPLQYVLGLADFCGLRIGVSEGVLIPRPETEELVQLVAGENPSARRILDIGTGSGCIALALKSLLPDAEVLGADISEQALAIARKNAAALELEVLFRQADALGDLPGAFPESFDVIVSNPPYIPHSEGAAMRLNVTAYEPAGALFVPDDDPLYFYRAIARDARQMLTPGGGLYFEIHESFGTEVCDLLRTEGYDAIAMHLDFHEKPRMVCCRKNA